MFPTGSKSYDISIPVIASKSPTIAIAVTLSSAGIVNVKSLSPPDIDAAVQPVTSTFAALLVVCCTSGSVVYTILSGANLGV